ncbi:MAG: hypothetical protein M1836_004688 [Candelina mexicana]|nr:MAG: hypothetical protein M1836_004688 [Candelina mexicana]
MARTSTISLISIFLLHLLHYPTLTSQLAPKLVKRPSSHSGSEVAQQASSGSLGSSGNFDTSSGDSSEYLEPSDPICSSAGFGHFSNVAACVLARDELPIRASEFATPFRFGPPGSEGTDVETPKYFAVNQCVIAISNSPDINTPDDGLWQALYMAVGSIINECVLPLQVGGHVSGEVIVLKYALGFIGNIGVSVFSRRPQENKKVYVTAVELEDDIKRGAQYPEPGSSIGQQHEIAGSEEPVTKKQKTCQAGESGYVEDAGSCCEGFTFTKQSFRDVAVQFGIKIGQAILEAGTFPTKPPTSRGPPPSPSPDSSGNEGSHSRQNSSSSQQNASPLPKRQLAVLAVIALAEQTALNSISPYLPEMASTFPGVDEEQVGLYTGLIASSFALAQLLSNYFWGWLSDRVGRKPVILIGTLLTAACFIAFGFCRELWQAIVVQVFMGLVNGNAGVVSTCLGEITDRSNQSTAFTYLPVIYGIGGITGPVVGGLLVNTNHSRLDRRKPNPYPFLPPNLVAAALLVVDLLFSMFFLEESLEEARDLPPLGTRVRNMFTWIWQFTSSTRPSYLRPGSQGKPRHPHQHADGVTYANEGDAAADDDDESYSDDDDDSSESHSLMPTLLPQHSTELAAKHIFNRDTILLLVTYLIFQLSNISYNSLYPIFAQAPPPIGRSLSTKEIGLTIAFAGIATIVFQVGVFGRVRDRLGNKITYRVGLAGFTIAFMLMPWVGYKQPSQMKGIGAGKGWLWAELCFVLLIKTVAAVGGLTSALLLITNSAPNHNVLGKLNGLAQTLSAAGRAAGPFISGGLFSVATHVHPKGEALAWGVFGGVAFIGFLLSFGIRGEGLEADGWDEGEGSEEDEGEDEHGHAER